ncbi:MAG: ABC transporter substrate-binding protein [Chloroflexota bacterium]
MNRVDSLIDAFVSRKISRRQMVQGAAALGLAAPALEVLGRSHVLAFQPAENSVRWVSPRGTVDVLDDYPYWVAKKMGYFGDLETTLEPGPMEATAGTKSVDSGQSDMAYPSPGVFSLTVEQGIPLTSVFQMGAYDVFDFAFRKGEKPESLKGLEGKTISLGSAGWQGITDPELAQAGVDPKTVSYVDAGQTWGQALAQGQVDSALAWAGLRAQWYASGLDFDYILGSEWSKFPANSFVIRSADYGDANLDAVYTTYLKGWAQGLEFGHQNPLAATQITMEALPALQEVFTDKQVAVESMWQLANVFRGDWATRPMGWGEASMESWNTFLKTAFDIGQLTKEIKAEDIISNKYVAGANDFDKEKVKADAMGFALGDDFKGLTVPEGAGM